MNAQCFAYSSSRAAITIDALALVDEDQILRLLSHVRLLAARPADRTVRTSRRTDSAGIDSVGRPDRCQTECGQDGSRAGQRPAAAVAGTLARPVLAAARGRDRDDPADRGRHGELDDRDRARTDGGAAWRSAGSDDHRARGAAGTARRGVRCARWHRRVPRRRPDGAWQPRARTATGRPVPGRADRHRAHLHALRTGRRHRDVLPRVRAGRTRRRSCSCTASARRMPRCCR